MTLSEPVCDSKAKKKIQRFDALHEYAYYCIQISRLAPWLAVNRTTVPRLFRVQNTISIREVERVQKQTLRFESLIMIHRSERNDSNCQPRNFYRVVLITVRSIIFRKI